MPVYNEDVARVFSGVRAIQESRPGPDFDFYILSDSTNPANWVAEELAWQTLQRELGEEAHIYYRHRARNIGRKSRQHPGLLRELGPALRLYGDPGRRQPDDRQDAGASGRADGRQSPRRPDPGAAQLVGRNSLFARIQQFASSVYGPLYTAGLAFLQGPDGNYWGHNAIIRVHAFMQHCGLPGLPGQPPFGGEIMSHDFVEAALAAPRRLGGVDGARYRRLVRGAAAHPDGLSDPRPPLVPGQSAASAHAFSRKA